MAEGAAEKEGALASRAGIRVYVTGIPMAIAMRFTR